MEHFSKIYFSEVFEVEEKTLRDYGAFDVCLGVLWQGEFGKGLGASFCTGIVYELGSCVV